MPQSTYPPVPDVARFDVRAVCSSPAGAVEVQNSLYVRNIVDAWTIARQLDVSAAIATAWTAEVLPLLNGNYDTERIVSRNLDVTGSPFVEYPYVASGSVGGDPESFIVACVVQLLGDAGFVPARSYLRMTGLPESAVDGNAITSSFRTDMAAAMQAVSDAISANDVNDAMVIVSVFEPGGTPPNIYRTTGQSNTLAGITARQLIGRAVSRQR